MSLLQVDINADSLWNFIERHTKKFNFRAHEQRFLPKRAFETITQENVIKQIIFQDRSLSPQEKDDFVTEVHQKGPKLFVTCIYCELPMSCLKHLLDDGLSDRDFPLTDDQCPGWSPRHQRLFTNCFLINQKRFNAPFFELDSFQKLDDSYPMPIDFDEDGSNLLGKGAFGEVWKVRIHKDHHSFDGVCP